jgi:hypothetical protein
MHLKPNSYFIHTGAGSKPGFILLAREEKAHIYVYDYPDELNYQEANKSGTGRNPRRIPLVCTL